MSKNPNFGEVTLRPVGGKGTKIGQTDRPQNQSEKARSELSTTAFGTGGRRLQLIWNFVWLRCSNYLTNVRATSFQFDFRVGWSEMAWLLVFNMLGNKNHDLVCLHFRLNNEKVKSSQNRLSLICFFSFQQILWKLRTEGSHRKFKSKIVHFQRKEFW